MSDDIYDFHYYSYRKVTCNHYLQMLELQDEMYVGKYPVVGCINILRVLNKIAKSGESVEDVMAKQDEYKKGEDYQKFMKDNEGVDEEDMPLTDPEGWDLYVKATKKPFEYMMKFASSVALANQQDP